MYFLEVIAIRAEGPSTEILVKRQLTWRNYLSAIKSTSWTLDQAQCHYDLKTGGADKLRFAGTVEQADRTLNIYFVTLPTTPHYGPLASTEALWINHDALLQRIMRKPKKFSPHLFQGVTQVLDHISLKKKIAV
ncbi:MAG: hypothetical protein ACK5TR_02320 [Alphaproteobacteria bacterium]|jgi:hypothetical protein|nr:hypothetical protein [Alphaproteobacteria bacterium]